jgi:hypothetical protein
MARTKDEAVRELAEWHFGVEPDLTLVIRIVGDDEDAVDEPIKLLEVNAATVATGSVEPYAFAASASVPFPTVIAEITPEEYERIRRDEIKLPTGWSLNKTQLFIRPQAACGAAGSFSASSSRGRPGAMSVTARSPPGPT